MPGHALRLAPILVGLALRTASGQDSTTAIPWASLTERPRPRETASAAGIRYPDMLRSARVHGDVRIELIVGADGRPERSSLRVLSSTHDLFTNAVRTAVGPWTFDSPMLDGRPVRATVPVSVSFVSTERLDEPWRDVAAVAADSSGFHISLGREPVPRQPGLVAERAEVTAATIAILSELMPPARAAVAGAMCVSWSASSANAPPDALRRLHAIEPQIKNANRCPATYASMILHVDSTSRPIPPPTAAPDPVLISARDVRPWTRDLYVSTGFVTQGTGSQRYFCIVRREGREASWKATCESRDFMVH
jgi:TonB family protein